MSTVRLLLSTACALPLSFHDGFCLRFRNNEIYDGQQGGKGTFYSTARSGILLVICLVTNVNEPQFTQTTWGDWL